MSIITRVLLALILLGSLYGCQANLPEGYIKPKGPFLLSGTRNGYPYEKISVTVNRISYCKELLEIVISDSTKGAGKDDYLALVGIPAKQGTYNFSTNKSNGLSNQEGCSNFEYGIKSFFFIGVIDYSPNPRLDEYLAAYKVIPEYANFVRIEKLDDATKKIRGVISGKFKLEGNRTKFDRLFAPTVEFKDLTFETTYN